MAVKCYVPTLPNCHRAQGLASALEANRLLAHAGYTPNGTPIAPKRERQAIAKRKVQPKRVQNVKPLDPSLVLWERQVAAENERRAQALRAQDRAMRAMLLTD